MKQIFERCLEDQPHKKHEWKPGFLWRKRWCLGRELNPWLKANPSIGTRMTILPKDLELPEPEPHRCFYRVDGFSTSANYIVFKCKDCPEKAEAHWDRSFYREYTLGIRTEQTWPG